MLLQILQEEIVPQSGKAGAKALFSNHIIRRTPIHIRHVMRIGCRHRIHVPILRNRIEHRTRKASFHEPNPLSVELLVVCRLNGITQFLIAQHINANRYIPCSSITNEISEYSVLRTSRQHLRILLSSGLRNSINVTRNNT